MDKKTRPIEELSNWNNNPRAINEKDFYRLKKQIKRLGMYKPLLVTKEGVVIGGNMRLRALRDMGAVRVWVEEIEFKQEGDNWYAYIDGQKQEAVFTSELQGMTEYAISDNDPAGYYDREQAAELLMPFYDLPEMQIYKLNLGNPASIRDLVSQYAPSGEEDNFDPTPPATATSKKGEIYQLGEHRLMCGDSTNPNDIDALMNGEKAEMTFTDPPYNVDYQGGMNTLGQNKRDGIMNDKMTGEQFFQFLNDAIAQMMRVTTGVFYICMSSSELDALKVAFESQGGHWQSFIIWVKDTFTLSRSDWQHIYEPILYGWNSANTKHYFAGIRDESNVWELMEGLKGKIKDGKMEVRVAGYKVIVPQGIDMLIYKSKKQLDIWRFDKPKKSDEHPTMKPIKLVEKASSKVGDIVLDSFGGSGTTLIASELTKRKCRMMELDPRFCDVIRRRYVELTTGDSAGWESKTPKIE